MYLMETHEGAEARDRCALSRPFGPALNSRDIVKAEVWATSVKDPGEYVEFRVTYASGATETHRIDGY
jgi:hypothetical protein